MKATRVCSVEGCTRAHHARGLCGTHYQRVISRGELPAKATTAERLAAGLVRMPNGCLEWTGYVDDRGYGRISAGSKHVKTHRLAWTLTNGAIPDGMLIRHYVCDNPPCCDPEHLRLGMDADNVADRDAKGRWRRPEVHPNTAKTHCKYGHLFDETNTAIRPNGSRRCRMCARKRKAEWKLRSQVTPVPPVAG